MSLRVRIVVWFVVAMTILFFALAFTAQGLMVAGLRAELDERLQLQAQLVATAIGSTGADSTTGYAQIVQQVAERQLVSIPIVIRVTDLEGRVKATFGDVPESVVSSLNLAVSLPDTDEGRFDNVKVREVEKLRVYTVQAYDPLTSTPFALIQTAGSLAPVTAAENQLWQYAVAEGVLGSLLTLSIGLIILRRGFRPLDKILDRVQKIGDTNLIAGLPREPRPPELQRLADSLNDMWRRLDAALRAKEAFVASVSHELRTPLTAIQGQIDFLHRQPSDNPEVKESLERTAREVRRLIRMTNNLLLDAQLNTKPALVQQPVNLRELVEGVIKEIQVLTRKRNLNLKEGEDVLVSGDYDLLKQAVLNVVDNAVKFTPRDGHIQLTLEQEEGWVILEVSDSGRGIPQEHLPHVTERFYQVPNAVGTPRGAGLGLSIVKQVIERHSGQIKITSREGVGTKVKMYLPIMLPSSSGNSHCTG
jgi:signal transduction histidine kinase